MDTMGIAALAAGMKAEHIKFEAGIRVQKLAMEVGEQASDLLMDKMAELLEQAAALMPPDLGQSLDVLV